MDKDPKYKKELERIRKLEFNRLGAYESLVAKYLAEYTGQKRSHETQADSMGLMLYLNCGYNPSYALKVISKLDSVDEILFKDSIDYSKYFGFANYPFKKAWLEKEEEESIGGNMDDSFEMPDSLKTHPDCKKRREALQILINSKKLTSTVEYVGNYNYYRELTQFEMVEYLQQDYSYARALYYVVTLLKKYPDNKYLNTSLLNCIAEINKAQKDHYFSQVVEYPNKIYGSSYLQFLTFLHNTNSTITKNFYAGHRNRLGKSSDAYLDYVSALMEGIESPAEQREGIVIAFSERHKNSYYLSMLENKLNVKSKTKK